MSVSATPATSVERQGESMYADPGASSWNVAATSPENASRGAGRLEAVDVSCWFSGHKVLDRVSLAMEASKVTALIGPSGCGKSTFLRALNRLHELTPGATLGGSVEFDGMDIYGPSARVTDIRLRIGWCSSVLTRSHRCRSHRTCSPGFACLGPGSATRTNWCTSASSVRGSGARRSSD